MKEFVAPSLNES